MKMDFRKTQPIHGDMAKKFNKMARISEIKLGLTLQMPFDEHNEKLRGAPTKIVDGKKFVDTSTLAALVDRAYHTHDVSLIPDVLDLRSAVQNILQREETHESGVARPLTISSTTNRIAAALSEDPKNPDRPTKKEEFKATRKISQNSDAEVAL